MISGAQMLIIGGTFPDSITTCDSQNSWGTHNLNLGKQNVDEQMWYDYLPNLTSYSVPSEIIAVVGGGPTGGATLKAPSEGFKNPDMTVYFGGTATAGVRTPTRAIPTSSSTPPPGSSRSLSIGAIVGIAIGGAAFLLILAFAGIFFIRRHRRKNDLPVVPAPAYSEAAQDFPSRLNHEYNPKNKLYARHDSVAQYSEMPSPARLFELDNTETAMEMLGIDPYHQQTRIPSPGNCTSQRSSSQQFSPVSQQTAFRDSARTELSAASTTAYTPDGPSSYSPTPTYTSIMQRHSSPIAVPSNSQNHSS